MSGEWRGVRILEDEPLPVAGAGGHDGPGGPGDDGGGASSVDWIIVEGVLARIDGEPRRFELAGWRKHRDIAGAPDPLAVAPAWICEEAERDRDAQLARYVGRGIGHVWLLDRPTRRLDVYRLGAERWTRIAAARGCAWLRAEPFESIELDLAAVWGTGRGT